MPAVLTEPQKQELDQLVARMRPALTDLAHFCRVVLGYREMIGQHDELCQFLQRPGSLKLILAPRHSFKSCMSTMGYTLWRLARDPNLRILIYSDTNEKAEAFLEEIKNHIEGKKARSEFRDLFGPWETDAKSGVWNKSAITIRPRTSAAAEPSVDTAGIETSKVGRHYDLIIFDDVVTDKNITTPELMQKVIQVFQKAHALLKPDGDVIVVGTRWHFGDLYGLLLSDPVKFPHLQVYKTSAEGDGTYPYAAIGLTQEKLAYYKGLYGTAVYSAIMQNEPTDDETALFKVQDFAFYQEVPQHLFITCGLDPIPPHDSTTGDDAALTIVGTDAEMNMYVLDILAGRLQPSEQVDALFRLHATWGIRTLVIETNAWQRTLVKDIELRVQQERRTNPHFRLFHVEEITRGSTTSKHLDIRGLQPYHERGALRLKGTKLELLTGDMKKLAFQMQQYPNAVHDDVLDSLSMHVAVHRAGDISVPTTEAPWGSAAWYEKEIWAKQQWKDIKSKPRWARPPVPQLAFN